MSKSSYWVRYGKRLVEKYGPRCFYCGCEMVSNTSILGMRSPKLTPDPRCPGILLVEAYDPRIMASVDHVIPRSKGGKNNIENLVPCCLSCNSRKNNRELK